MQRKTKLSHYFTECVKYIFRDKLKEKRVTVLQTDFIANTQGRTWV